LHGAELARRALIGGEPAEATPKAAVALGTEGEFNLFETH
jgi:hypothetical protein